jgi:hypothetical protein
MNGSAIAACALVACETEFLIRRVAGTFERRRLSLALERVGIWVVPPTPVPARVQSRGFGSRWHLLLSIVAAAGTIALDAAAVNAQCGGGYGSCGCCGSSCGGPSFFGSPCGGRAFFGSPCGGSPCCGSPCGSSMPFFGRPCGGCPPSCCRPACQPMGCCGGCSSGCGCQRSSFALFPSAGCGPVCGPRCGPSCGSPCGCPCGPSCGLACGPVCGCGMPGCGVGGCGSGGLGCGPVAGTPVQTFEGAPSGPLPSPSNTTGPPSSNDPGDQPPGGPPTPIKQRPVMPPDGSQKFERQPQGSLDSGESFDVSQASADPVGVVVKRYFRQTVSAGFHTRVAVAEARRPSTWNVARRTPASRDFEEPRIVARTD